MAAACIISMETSSRTSHLLSVPYSNPFKRNGGLCTIRHLQQPLNVGGHNYLWTIRLCSLILSGNCGQLNIGGHGHGWPHALPAVFKHLDGLKVKTQSIGFLATQK